MKAPNGRLSGEDSAQPRRQGGHSGAVAPKSFFVPPKFCCTQKNLFQR